MKRPLIDKEIIKLIEDVMHGVGMIRDEDRRYTEAYNEPKPDVIEKKIVTNNIGGYAGPQPGCRVKIIWDNKIVFGDDDPEFEPLEDCGYIFTLPGFDSDDIWMSGIVHIPEPCGCEKSKCEPEWIYLNRLVSMEGVIKIEFLKDEDE